MNDPSLLRVTAALERLRQHMTQEEISALSERLAIAIERARTRNSPQAVEIKINDKGYIQYIDPTDHYGKVMRKP